MIFILSAGQVITLTSLGTLGSRQQIEKIWYQSRTVREGEIG